MRLDPPGDRGDATQARQKVSYGSDAFRAYAESLLAPLVEGANPELLPTLEAYLEHESSTASTAATLGVHRNTVAHRISRAGQLFVVSLALSDERLTLQLACRVPARARAALSHSSPREARPRRGHATPLAGWLTSDPLIPPGPSST